MNLTDIEKYLMSFRHSKHKYKRDFDPEFRYVSKGFAKVPKKYLKFNRDKMTIGDVAFILRKRSGLTLRQISPHLGIVKDIVAYRENNPKYFGRTHHNIIALSNWMTQKEANWVMKKFELTVALEGRDTYEPPKQY